MIKDSKKLGAKGAALALAAFDAEQEGEENGPEVESQYVDPGSAGKLQPSKESARTRKPSHTYTDTHIYTHTHIQRHTFIIDIRIYAGRGTGCAPLIEELPHGTHFVI